jgi:hypothetical protein
MPTSRPAPPPGNPNSPKRSDRPRRRYRHSRGIGTGRRPATGSAAARPARPRAGRRAWRPRGGRPIRSRYETGLGGRPGRRGSRSRPRGASCRFPANSRRTTHVVESLPARVRLTAAPAGLRDVVLEVVGWRTDLSGETVLRCGLPDGSVGEIPARWTDVPWRNAPEPSLGGFGSPAAWRLLLARGERLAKQRPQRVRRVAKRSGGGRMGARS